MKRLAVLALLGSMPWMAAFAAADTTPAPAKPMGTTWEVTSQMSMEGAPMALPSHTSKVCAAANDSPVEADERHKCSNTDFKRDGSKVTWKTVCEGGMAGEGEMTYSDANTYAGTIKFTSSHGNMTVKLSGKNLGTPCEVKK